MTKICNEKETIKYKRIFLDEKKISPHLFCTICKQVFNNPVVLNNCNHTFCYECIKQKLKDKDECPICHIKNLSSKLSKNLLAYNLIMELEVSCNNMGICPWIGHLSELVSHQIYCNKAIKVLEENNKNLLKNITKNIFNKDIVNEKKNQKEHLIFSQEENKNKKICKETTLMIKYLKSEKVKKLSQKEGFNNEHDKNQFKLQFTKY